MAAEEAGFGTPEINVGVFPFMIMALIYRNVPRKKTTELLLLGERITAAEAERIGIVNKVVPRAELDAAVDDWAAKLASKSPLLMRMGKDAMFRQQDMAFMDALDYLRGNLSHGAVHRGRGGGRDRVHGEARAELEGEVSSGSRIFRDGLLEGQVAIVSGAGSGLGRETALELTRLGATVVGCGRREEPLAETAELAGERFDAAPCDIREEDQVAALVDGALERHGRIDLLVNNAGGQYLTPAEDINPKGFRTVMRLNVEGTWLMTHAVATKAMIPAGGGKVVSVTLSPHNGMPGMVHSGAARAAVENMMRTLSVEWARFGIKLNALAAGQFGTDTLLTKYPKQIVDGVAASVPLQRMGEPEELAWLVAYLASPAGDFTSGSVITVDGARDNWMGPWPPAAIAGESGSVVPEERKPK